MRKIYNVKIPILLKVNDVNTQLKNSIKQHQSKLKKIVQ